MSGEYRVGPVDDPDRYVLGVAVASGAEGILYRGTITTAGGVSFRAATTDANLRAYDNASGKELWKGALPVQAAGTPMTYVSPKTGKQYVVITAGGASMTPKKGDYVIAYALP